MSVVHPQSSDWGTAVSSSCICRWILNPLQLCNPYNGILQSLDSGFFFKILHSLRMKLEHTYNFIISYDMVLGNQLSQYEDLRSISRTCSKKSAWHGSVPLSLKYWRNSERAGHMGSLTSQPNMCVSLLVPETSFQKQSGHKCALVHRCTHAHMHAHTHNLPLELEALQVTRNTNTSQVCFT